MALLAFGGFPLQKPSHARFQVNHGRQQMASESGLKNNLPPVQTRHMKQHTCSDSVPYYTIHDNPGIITDPGVKTKYRDILSGRNAAEASFWTVAIVYTI